MSRDAKILDYNIQHLIIGLAAPNMRNHTTHTSFENSVYVTM
jgi:hypothetical protein